MIVLTARWGSLDQAILNARKLGDEVGRFEVLDRALLTVGRDLRDDLARGTPRSKVAPHLADQWRAVVSKEERGQGRSVVKVGPKAGKGSVGYVAVFLEFGTWKMAPRAWIRPTWDAWKGTFRPALTAAIAKHYKRVVKKYTRKARR